MSVDPSTEYPFVDGVLSDTKHPNGDIDRIGIVGDHTIGKSFVMRGEPIVWAMNAIESVRDRHVISAYFHKTTTGVVVRKDTIIRQKPTFTREISSAQINSLVDRMWTFIDSQMCVSTNAPIVRSNLYSQSYLSDNEDFKVDQARFATYGFDHVRRFDRPRKTTAKAIVSDMEYIMDGSCILVPDLLTPPEFVGAAIIRNPPYPSDCSITNTGEVPLDESSLGRNYINPSCSARKIIVDGEEKLLSYVVLPIFQNAFSVRMYNAAESSVPSYKLKKHETIVALFKIQFSTYKYTNPDNYFWYPVTMTENPPGMATVPMDAFSGIFETICSEYGIDMPSRDNPHSIDITIKGVNLIVKLKGETNQ